MDDDIELARPARGAEEGKAMSRRSVFPGAVVNASPGSNPGKEQGLMPDVEQAPRRDYSEIGFTSTHTSRGSANESSGTSRHTD